MCDITPINVIAFFIMMIHQTDQLAVCWVWNGLVGNFRIMHQSLQCFWSESSSSFLTCCCLGKHNFHLTLCLIQWALLLLTPFLYSLRGFVLCCMKRICHQVMREILQNVCWSYLETFCVQNIYHASLKLLKYYCGTVWTWFHCLLTFFMLSGP